MMREQEFRSRFRRAIGEASPLPSDFSDRLASRLPSPSWVPRAGAWAVAMMLLFALVGALVISRWGLPSPSHFSTLPAGPPPRAASTPAARSCRLPLVVTDSTQPASSGASKYESVRPQVTGGMVTIPSGTFVADPAARQDGMPFSAMAANAAWEPATYDPVVKRWLSESPERVSPDHQRYAYVVFKPLMSSTTRYESAELRVYDLRTGADRLLWSHDGSIQDVTWKPDGLHLTTTPATGGQGDAWLVDPATGAASADPSTPSPGTLNRVGVRSGTLGTDSQGRPVIIEGSRDPGVAYTIFVVGAAGRRLVIYSGHMGDAMDFDPTWMVGDGDALWGANYDGTAIWRWTEAGGLQKYPLQGVAQHDMYVNVRVAGPCLQQ